MKNAYHQTLVAYLQRKQFLFHLILQCLLSCLLVWSVKTGVFETIATFLMLAILISWFAAVLGQQLQTFLSHPSNIFLPYAPKIHLWVIATIALPMVAGLSLPVMLQLPYSLLGMCILLMLAFILFIRQGSGLFSPSFLLPIIFVIYIFLPKNYAYFTLKKTKEVIFFFLTEPLTERFLLLVFGVLAIGTISLFRFGVSVLRPDKESMFEDRDEDLEDAVSTTTDMTEKEQGYASKCWTWLTNPGGKKLDGLSGPIGNGILDHIYHWQLGGVLHCAAPIFFGPVFGVLIFSSLIKSDFPFYWVWLIFFAHLFGRLSPVLLTSTVTLAKLGYESLRPVTRQQFILQIGLAMVFYIFESWLYACFTAITTAGVVAIWNPALFYKIIGLWPLLILFTSLLMGVPGFIGWAIIGESMFDHYRRSRKGKIFLAALAFLLIILGGTIAVALVIYVYSNGINDLKGALTLFFLSLLINYTAYRKWCKADLG